MIQQKEKGVTMITLVITIVLMLILVGTVAVSYTHLLNIVQ